MHAILVLGYGSIGKRHREVLAELYPKARIDVVSGHEEPREGFFPSLGSVADLSEYDYFVIASRTASHADDLAAIDECVKDRLILVEKPLFSCFAETRRCRNEIYVGYNLRFHPILQKLKLIIETKKILTINVYTGQYLPSWRPGTDYRFSYSASSVLGGGVLLDLSHEIDYLQWLCGDLTIVRAMNRKLSSLQIESDDVVAFVGQTSSGAVATVALDYLSRKPQRRIIIQTESSTVLADLIEGRLEVYEGLGDEVSTLNGKCERNYTYREMHRSIVSREARACTFEEGLSVMRTIAKIRESERTDWNG